MSEFFLALIPLELFYGLIFLSGNRKDSLRRHSLAAEDAFARISLICDPLDVPQRCHLPSPGAISALLAEVSQKSLNRTSCLTAQGWVGNHMCDENGYFSLNPSLVKKLS